MSYTEKTVTFKTTPDFELGMANHHRETNYFMVMPEYSFITGTRKGEEA